MLDTNATETAPDPNQGNNSDFLNNFLDYKRNSDLHHLDMMKQLAEFQSNLRLNDIAKQMNLQRSEANMPPKQELTPRSAYQSSVAEPNPIMPGGLGRGGVAHYDPYESEKLAQIGQRIANQKTESDQKLQQGQEGLDIKRQGLETPQQKEARQLAEINARGTNATNLENVREPNREKLENTREGNREKLEGVKQPNRVANINLRGQQLLNQIKAKAQAAKELKQTPNPNFSGNLPSQELIRRMNTAQQVINENPELAKFIRIDPNTKNVTVTQPSAPSAFSFLNNGPSPQQYQQILDKLYPQGRPTLGINDQTQSQTPPTVRVKDANGKMYDWDTTKGAVPNGYTPVNPGGQEEEE